MTVDAAPDRSLLPDTTWLRLDATTVLAGSPVRMFRVSAAGGRILDAIEQGEALPRGHEALTDRLLAAGAAHPDAATAPEVDLRDLTVVVPTYGEPVDRIAALVSEFGSLPVVVVDDGAPIPLDTARVGRRVLRLPVNAGPGAARNAGLALVETPFVLFLDADASIGLPALHRLLALARDERVAAVAPRVHAPSSASTALERYEAVRSPLDMGPNPALVRAGTRVSYVPAAVLLCRTAAIRAVGGFDESLRYGEDVDLVWRLADAGGAVRYDPGALARHTVRPSVREALRQRYRYGTAAGPLAARHPGALAPVRITRWSGAAWATLAFGHPLVAAALAAAGGAPLARKLAAPDGRRRWAIAARVTATGNLHAGRQLADAVTGVWLPAALAAAVVSRRARRILLAAVVVPAGLEWIGRRPRIDPGRYLLLRTLERAAYGVGVARSAVEAADPGALLPTIE